MQKKRHQKEKRTNYSFEVENIKLDKNSHEYEQRN